MKRLILAGVTAVAFFAGGSPEAVADEVGPLRVEVVGENGDLADLGLIAPGEVRSGEMFVTNAGTVPVTMRVTAVDIIDREDGCVGGERRVDASCDSTDGAGDLSEGAAFSLWDATTEPVHLFTGTIHEMDDVPLGGASLMPGQRRTFRLDYRLVSGADDALQGDQLGFALEIVYQARGASVGGIGLERVEGSVLPRTGRDLSALAASAALTICSGLGLTLLARRRSGAALEVAGPADRR